MNESEPGEQLQLIDMESTLVASEKAQHLFTGENVRQRDPVRYQKIVDMLAQGCSFRHVAEMFRCSRNLVTAIAKSGAVEPHKQRIASKLRIVTEVCTERIMERIMDDKQAEEVSLRDLSIALGVAADKSQVLSGGASQIIQVDINDPGRDDYQALLAGHKAIDITEAVTIGLPSTSATQIADPESAQEGAPGAGMCMPSAGSGSAPDGVPAPRADIMSAVTRDFPNELKDIIAPDGVLDAAPGAGDGVARASGASARECAQG
jgi:hypothetical protein